MLGDAMSSSPPHQVTSEEVSCGAIPHWLVLHMKRQALGPRDGESDETGRILVLYPSKESRRQTLSEIDEIGAIDRTLHHSIESL